MGSVLMAFSPVVLGCASWFGLDDFGESVVSGSWGLVRDQRRLDLVERGQQAFGERHRGALRRAGDVEPVEELTRVVRRSLHPGAGLFQLRDRRQVETDAVEQ